VKSQLGSFCNPRV
jgi:hypothetical protein